MDNKKDKYKKELLKVINDHNIMRIDHAFPFTSFSRSTAYNHGLDKLDEIRESLELNRVKEVNNLLQRWIRSDNPTLQIAAMRLICSSEEHQLLNQSYVKQDVSINEMKLPEYFTSGKSKL